MKNLFLLLAGSSLVFLASCDKNDGDKNVSQNVQVSRPTITFTSSPYVSIRTGGTIPTVTATSYDSVLGESYPVTVVGQDEVDNTTPGLYIISATAKNRYGFEASENIYVGVTNAEDIDNLAGTYLRTSNNEPVHVTRLARALYLNDDIGGAPTLEVPVVFVRLSDTSFDIPPQPSSAGTISATGEKLTRTPTDTTFSYSVRNSSFGTAVRTFKKQ